MAALTNPINKQNIVDRFADFVVATANSGISWGTNNKPIAQLSDAIFGGSTAGKVIGITGANITGTVVTASTIYNVLLAETATYTRIRKLRVQLNRTGPGRVDNPSGQRIDPGIIFDQTAVANLNTDYLQSISSSNVDDGGVEQNNVASVSNLESLFTNLRTAYNASRENVTLVTIDVCHASCHSSCHSSRGRR